MVLAVAALILRLALGDLAARDAVLVAITPVLYPFVEWTAHRFVLHAPGFRFRGRVRQLGVTRNHAAHHLRPEDLSKVASETGRNLTVAIVAASVPFALVLRELRPTITAVAMVCVGLWVYEVAHLLIHTGFGENPLLRRLRRNHLRHHYVSEAHWFGVASPFADWMLRTAPTRADVPVSEIARQARTNRPRSRSCD